MRYPDGIGGFYELNPFPGCNQIIISNHSWIPQEQRGKGQGGKVHQFRLKMAENLGYDYILCTVKADNIPQIRILEKNGWKRLDSFDNRETKNLVFLYGKQLYGS